MEVRGSVTDRPWGLTLGAIAARRHTGQIVIESDNKSYGIAFHDGAIVGAVSPLAADAIARVALTNHFITSTQVPEITRRLAASPDRDEVDVIAEAVRFAPDQVLRLRHRLVAQRAARTFAVEHGAFVLGDTIALPVAPGIAVDHRHVIYLGIRTNVSQQRLLDDLRQLGSHFVLRPEAIDDLPRYGFEPAAEPVIEALQRGTSLPELEATHRELDPRFAQAIIYALVSCTACTVTPRTGSQAPLSRTATPPPRPGGVSRTITPVREAPSSRTTTRPMKPAAMGTRSETVDANPPPERRPRMRSEPLEVIGVTRNAASQPSERIATPPSVPIERIPPGATVPVERVPTSGLASDTQPLAVGTDTFPSTPAGSLPRRAQATTPPAGSRVTTSPFASRTRTSSPSAYAAATSSDAGTNTPAARARSQSDPAGAPGAPRTQTRSPTPSAPRTQTPTPSAPRTQTPTPSRAQPTLSPARAQPATLSPARTRTAVGPATTRAPAATTPPGDSATQLPAAGRVDTEETRFTEVPTPLPDAAKQRAVFSEPQRPGSSRDSRPNIPRAPTPAELSFADQRTPGFSDQRTPGFGDQRTPMDRPGEHRTPTDSGLLAGGPSQSRVTTDNVAAAEEAFKRGELAMKRDQPGEAILEFKAACDLNPQEIDYAAMLAWAKFCAAGDKPGIGVDTRRALERAVFRSQRPERARFYLGRVERMLGRDKEALRHFQEVLELKPNHADAQSEIRAIEARLAAAKGGTGLFGRKR